jgi:hypothetical protein
MPIIPVGEWAPDQAPLGNPGLIQAQNVIPAENSYRPFPDLQSSAIAPLADRVRGGIAVSNNLQTQFIVAGTAGGLFVFEGLAFQDVSRVAGYNTTADQRWEFAAFDTRVIGTNFADPVQVKDLNDPIATDFADLFVSTLKPQARHIATVAAFLLMGNTTDAVDGAQPDRLWWTAFRDPTDADPDSATQSNFIPLIGGGAIQRIVGGAEYGVILQERQISRATYVGGGSGSPIFDVIAVDRGRGTPLPGSVAARGREVYFYSEDGFHYFDGSQSVPIGAQRVDREFARRFQGGDETDVYAAIDVEQKLYMILFPGSGSPGLGSEIFAYHWPTGRWAETEQIAEIIFESAVQSLTLETAGADFANIDTSPFANISVDSPIFQGGEMRLAAFDQNHALSFFSGPPKRATVDTAERQMIPNRLALINRVRPLVEGGQPEVAVLTRDDLTALPVLSAFGALESDGQVDIHETGRYHRFRVRIGEGQSWTHILGVQVEDQELQNMGIQ